MSVNKPVNLVNDKDVKVERDTRDFNGSNEDKMSKFYLDEAAKSVAPTMAEPIGSIGIHFYRQPITNSIIFVTQNQCANVQEQVVVIGIQQAMYSLMEAFGHTRPAGVK